MRHIQTIKNKLAGKSLPEIFNMVCRRARIGLLQLHWIFNGKKFAPLLLHRPVKELQNAQPGKAAGDPNPDDHDLISRIIEAYRRTTEESRYGDASVWEQFFNERHRKSHDIFMNGTIDQAAQIFRFPLKSDLFYGFDSLCKSYRLFDRKFSAVHSLSNLLRFGEAIGAIDVSRQERYLRAIPGKEDMINVEDSLQKIETCLGQELTFPNPFPEESGLATKRGVLSLRATQALFQGWRIAQLTKDIPNPRVLEIGAGLGRTAFFARQFGVSDYTIVDIPFTGLSQGYYLGRVLGSESVLLNGEAPGDDADRRVKVQLPSYFLEGDQQYDLIVNVDSLTEMDADVMKSYWQKIKTSTKMFLSINHEGNPVSVRDIIADDLPGISVTRTPYWLRTGYIEELIKIPEPAK